MNLVRSSFCIVVVCALLPTARSVSADNNAGERFLRGDFRWKTGAPLLSPVQRADDPCYSVKDPSVVRFENRWHLFCTIRSQKRSHQIEYCNFDDWRDASTAPRHILHLSDGYFCAPEIFYFAPHKLWYLIYQVNEESRKPSLQPAFSTNANIGAVESWTHPRLLFDVAPSNVSAWIDFWIICDETTAHLFFTSPDGQMWRAQTTLARFPNGWSAPAVVLRDDIFEASHTYRLKGQNAYFTLVEAQAEGGRRYYKAYLANRLDGEWTGIAASREKPFASPVNVRDQTAHWTDSFSHGELLRSGYDEKLEVDPASARFLFQGVSDSRRLGKKYGEIPWQLGLLEPDPQ